MNDPVSGISVELDSDSDPVSYYVSFLGFGEKRCDCWIPDCSIELYGQADAEITLNKKSKRSERKVKAFI